MAENKELLKESKKEIINIITDNTVNKSINYMFYDIKGLEKRKTEFLTKVILDLASEEDKLRLEAVDKILKYHESGKRIDELKMEINV